MKKIQTVRNYYEILILDYYMNRCDRGRSDPGTEGKVDKETPITGTAKVDSMKILC